MIWALLDDRAGNNSQTIGVARELGEYELINIEYSYFAKWPNFIRGSSLFGVKNKKDLRGGPDVVVASGRKLAPIAKYIKKHSPNTKLIHIMNPGCSLDDFDLVALPMHDKANDHPVVFRTLGAPNYISKSLLDKELAKYFAKFSMMPAPYTALLFGGTTKIGEFSKSDIDDLAQKVRDLIQDIGGSILITTSRRTSQESKDYLKEKLSGISAYFYDYSKSNQNPYFAFLAASNIIITTSDSISMCSEACSIAKPVYIYVSEDITPQKHKEFINNLFKKKYAISLNEIKNKGVNLKTLNDAKSVANYAKKIKLLS